MRYTVRRFGLMVLLILSVLVLVFAVVRLIPGDVVDVIVGSEGATRQQEAALRRLYGLNKPIYIQFGAWFGALLRGHLGRSPISGLPVLQQVAQRFPITLELTLITLALATVLGVPVGTYMATRRHGAPESAMGALTVTFLSIPYFVTGIVLILVVSVYLPGLFVVGYVSPASSVAGNVLSILPPAISLAVPVGAIIARMTRGSVLDELGREYIRTARAKGIGETATLFRHVLRNAYIPILTQMGFQASFVLGGSVVTEEIFSIPGLGRLVYEAILKRDYPTLQGGVLVLALTIVVINFGIDMLYGVADPRIRY